MGASGRNAWISLGLFFLALLWGGVVFSIILASVRPGLGMMLLLAGPPLVLIPFAIGRLTPSLWFLGGAGGAISLYSVLTSLIYSLSDPVMLEIWPLQWPLFLPLLISLAFAYLGRLAGRRPAKRSVISPRG